jgi:NAD(P)H-dependent FMN reductase
LLKSAARHSPPEIEARLYDRLSRLPAFNPDDDAEAPPAEARRLREAIHHADAVFFSTPEYAGALPGSLKNLLDWTIGDADPRSIYEKPVGWVNASPRGADGAHAELRTVLTYAHARIIEPACARVPVTGQMVGADGLVTDEGPVASVVGLLTALAAAAPPAGRGSERSVS